MRQTQAEAESVAASTEVPPAPAEMSAERKAWLEDALTNITINPVERMKLCIEKIKNPTVTDEELKGAAEELSHWCEELDLAKDFFTLGGMEILPILLDHISDNIRVQGCSLIASLVQNNDHCQRIVVQSNLLQKLLKILDENETDDCKIKAVTAISALIRGYTLGQLQLQKFNGYKILIKHLSTPIPKLQLKLCFLINILCTNSQHMKKLFYENGALNELIRLFVSETCTDHYHVVEAILSLSDAKKNVFQSLKDRQPQLSDELEQTLKKRLEFLKQQEHSVDQCDEMALIIQLETFMEPSES